ncbi:MAG TPA: hypothetical protein VGK36_08750 [Candidatus Angelobacter sp.]
MNKPERLKRFASQKLTSLKRPAQKFFQELVLVAGLGLVCFGIVKIYVPAGIIAAGLFLVVLSIVKPAKESK